MEISGESRDNTSLQRATDVRTTESPLRAFDKYHEVNNDRTY